MIELDRHIEILLLYNDCVIVPGLGGFMAHHVEAHFDEEDFMFFPPLRSLGFNPQLKLNDSLLAQSYVEAYDISYPEALRRIEEEVNELKQHLDNEGFFVLNGIGALKVNDDGNIVFEPCEAGILTPSLYGLSSFEMKPINDSAVDCGLMLPDKGREDEELSASYSKGQTQEEEGKTIQIKVAWIRNAVAVVAAVIAFFVFATPISNSTRSVVATSDIGNSVLVQFSPKEMTKGEVKLTSEQVQQAMTQNDADTLAKNIKADEENRDSFIHKKDTQKINGYCIVLASHVTRRNAANYVERLHREGYDDAYVYEHNGMVRVVYGNYESRNNAYSELQKVRDCEYFNQSWVYKKK